jgi:ABC-type nitrate/sulfonate/bicarbonate transport system ATPase subunit
MLPPIIRIDNIVKKYGPLTVLDGLSMNVMPGEKLALIGPSGSGETTILRSTEDVAAVKDGEGGAIFIHGSAELGRRLGEAGLIDRYHLLLFPWLLGSGKSVFSEQDQERRALRLRETDSYANGVVKLVYEVVR